MRILLALAIAAGAFVAVADPAHAGELDLDSGTITDRYIGANDNGYFDEGTGDDAIGSYKFNIHSTSLKITGTKSDGKMVFKVSTNFVDHHGELGAEYGDLFFHTGPGYTYDSSLDNTVGGDWYGLADDMNDFAFKYGLSLGGDLDGLSGTATLYEVDLNAGAYDTGAVKESDDFFGTAGNHRNHQEVRVDTSHSGNTALNDFTASWEINQDEDYILFTIAGDLRDLGFWGTEDVAWHWAMTCGNDTVQAHYAPVPEPGTVLLLGAGFAGLAYGRRRRKARAAE